jgi:hypothetical protein
LNPGNPERPQKETAVKKNGNADQRFVWGWLRLVLGIAQMTLAITTFGVFLIVGFRP